MFYAYVIKSKSNGKLYKGHTNNLAKRLFGHNSGDSPYSRNNGPWEIVHYEEFSEKRDAILRENFFKTGKGREYLKELLKIGMWRSW